MVTQGSKTFDAPLANEAPYATMSSGLTARENEQTILAAKFA